ncbi:MAG TPA: DUF1015 domain-containing protein [Flexilinea sp.]|jgi:hypothetical protein|nr:DUF1015 domain-containing protein [Flexilinea sp.]
MSKPTIISSPEILLPNKNVDLTKWATIACDQFTSNKAYWDEVESIVGDSPSTLKITFPEYYLGKIDEAKKIQEIQDTMYRYLRDNLFVTHNGMILVERQIHNGLRYGLLTTIDLEEYDYNRTSTSWIRATEGTVAERIPPRVRIREGAPLEVPHILVLIDDDQKRLIEPLIAQKESLPVLYDFDLMLNSGHVKGYSLANPELEQNIMDVIAKCQSNEEITRKYGPVSEKNRILFAIGDGNHSLATAKAIWEKHKSEWGMNHPARYALVEIENLHDPVLEFEPIHRALFHETKSLISLLGDYFQDSMDVTEMKSMEQLFADIDHTPDGVQAFGVLESGKYYKVVLNRCSSALCVGSVQQFLDRCKSDHGFEEIDYIHGKEDLIHISSLEGNAGIYLPPVQKNGFFQSIINDGALPRKTFSMGEAHEKRFYIECRRIL